MAQTLSRIRVRPARDEWGVYDPEQAGLAALYARLDHKDPKSAPAKPAVTAAPGAKPERKDQPARPAVGK